jgi:phenylacetate-coenzyme A ligase PaaK-like adenylate-forming protein
MPLIRYRTGDCGYVLPYSRVNRILRALNYSEYVPRLTTPLLAVAGRTDQSLTVKGKAVRMEFLRALLYSEPGLASATTGQFRVEERGGTLRVRIQLQADIEPSRRATIQSQFSALFNRHVPATVRAVPYFDFREVLSVDYEQKFQHRSPEPLHGE